MERKVAVAALLPALFLYACNRAVAPAEQDTGPANGPNIRPEATVAAAMSSPVPSPDDVRDGPPPGYTDGSGVNEGYPDLSPMPLTPEAERTVKGATNVLMSFARAIELKEFDQAWALLSEADKRKWPKAEFTKMFADLGKLMVAFAGGSMEGAAGSSYYTTPLTITSTDRNGRPVRYGGKAVLRRVNDVDGASPAQLRWHFESVALDWTH